MTLKTPHPVFDLWCQWCVDHTRFIPFEQWIRYTHPVDPIGRAILDYTTQTEKAKALWAIALSSPGGPSGSTS